MSFRFEARFAAHYQDLSEKLRLAGERITADKIGFATRSLRTMALDTNLPPATYTRLSQALGYNGFEQLKDELRGSLAETVDNFSTRAARLQDLHGADPSRFFDNHIGACIENLNRMQSNIDREQLEETIDRLHSARTVLLLGALGSTGVVEYMSYMASFFADNWSMAGRMGASLGSGLAHLDERDVLLIVTKPPFAARAIKAAELARSQGAFVIVITDTISCPALKFASTGFVVPTETSHFFSSYVATILLLETIVGELVARAGVTANSRIAKVGEKSRLLEEVWDL